MQKIATVAVLIMAACVVVLTGTVVHREFFEEAQAPVTGPIMRQVQGWQALASTGHVLGPPNAPIKIIEFSDFQCPFCAAAESSLSALVQRGHGRVAVVYRNYPITQLHRYALQAAIAAECASDQGRFAAYHNALFRFQDSLGIWTWSKYAQVAQVRDTARLMSCVAHQTTRARVERDHTVGDSLHIVGTPTFVAAGKLFMGAPSDSTWNQLLGLDQ